jgi:hypothetical protein
MQKRVLREYAAKRGWTVAMQVKKVGSGAGQRQLREKLLDAARRRDIDVVLVWRLDRWGRSVADLVSTLQELEKPAEHKRAPRPPLPRRVTARPGRSHSTPRAMRACFAD